MDALYFSTPKYFCNSEYLFRDEEVRLQFDAPHSSAVCLTTR